MSVLLFVFMLTFPATAYALPSPFTLIFALDVLVQAGFVALLLIPRAADAFKRGLDRYLPSSGLRIAGFIAVLAGTSIVLSATLSNSRVLFRTVTPDRSPLEERLAACAPLSEQEAAEMGLRPNSIIVDVRPPGAFAAYHLVRSCNLTVDELAREGDRIRNAIGASITDVYLAAEYELSLRAAFANENGPEWARFHSLPGGIKRYYKNGDSAFGWGPAPNLVVDGEGRPVNMQVGPFWFMGRYSAFPTPSTWRRLPESAFEVAHAKGAPIIDLRERNCADHALCLAPWRAFASSVDPELTEENAGAVLICDQPHECMLAADLGAELASKGALPMGYIVADRNWSPPAIEGGVQSPVVPYAALFGAPFVAAFGWFFVRGRVRRLRRPRLRMYDLGAGVLAMLATVVVTSRVIGSGIDPESPATRWMTFYLSDAPIVGLPAIVASLVIVPITLVHAWERALGRQSRLLRGVTIIGIVGIAMSRVVGDWTMFVAALLCAIALGPVLVEVVEAAWAKREARKLSGCRWVPLSGAVSPSVVGAKAYWVGHAARDGMAVPESLVLLGRPKESIDRHWLERVIRARLGDGPLIVRSSAPDEDEEGSLSAGRYRSVAIDSVSDVAEAVREVFADYVAKGIDGNAEAAVLIQHRVSAPWAGIAVRAPAHRGGGIVVECSRDTNVDITAGAGAERVGTIGAIGKKWIEGENAPPIPEKVLVEVFDRYEPRLGGAIQIEWAWDGEILTLLQVRRAPREESPPLALDAAAKVLARMRGSLQWLARRPSTPVLQLGELADYQIATSRATEELLAAMWAREGGHRHALRLLGNAALPKPPKPSIVRIDGCLFENLVSDVPVRRLLMAPIHRLGRLWLRATLASRIARIQSELVRWANDPNRSGDAPARSVQDAARRILELRGRIVEGPGAVAVAVSLLDQAWRGQRSATPRILGDALLADLAAGVNGHELAKRHPRRAIPDLALERPRLGEGLEAVSSESGTAPVEASGRDIDEQLAYLRGRARVVLAEYAADLREAYLQLGRLLDRDDVFEITDEALKDLALSNVVPAPATPPSESRSSFPLTVSLLDLERWASLGEIGTGAAQRSKSGFWVGDPEQCECVVVNPNEAWAGRGRPVIVVDVPTVEMMASVANDVVVVARAGTRLCHAAMIARERGIAAVFGAGDAVSELGVGEWVRVHRSGEIERIGGGGG